MPTPTKQGPIFQPFWVTGTDMSGALTSEAFKCGDWLITSAQIEWPGTGAPVGVFSFEGSNDSTDGQNGNFRPITITIVNQPAGTTSGEIVDLSCPWRWIRIKYTRTSGGAGAVPVVTFFGKRRG